MKTRISPKQVRELFSNMAGMCSRGKRRIGLDFWELSELQHSKDFTVDRVVEHKSRTRCYPFTATVERKGKAVK